jgi:hypothetical protein
MQSGNARILMYVDRYIDTAGYSVMKRFDLNGNTVRATTFLLHAF